MFLDLILQVRALSLVDVTALLTLLHHTVMH